MPSRLHPVVLMLAALAPPAAASDQPQVLTFDGNTQSSFQHGVFEAGYRFANDQSLTLVWDNDGPPGGAANGTKTLMAYRYGLTMDRRDGQPFTLTSLDIGLNWSDVPSYDVTATLHLADGGTVQRVLAVNDQAFTSWAFGERVHAVVFDGPFDAYLTLDNVALTGPVPEPAGWALGLAGLAVLAARGRLRRDGA